MQLNQPMKGTSLRERREYLWLMKLRTVPQFAELVRRFARGQSVWATTVWFMSQENRGELSNCSFEMTRKYLTTLSIRIKEQNDRLPKMDMRDFHKVGVVAGVESKVKAALKGMPDPAGADHISKVLTEALEKVNAMTILKYAFALQQQRVIELMEIEKKAKVPFPHTNKAIELLKDIGDAVRKVELGEAYLRKGGMGWGSPFSGELVPKEPVLLPEVQAVAELPEVEQNLVRDAASKIIDLIQMEAKCGPYSSRGRDE